ncbi:VCBS domain-containing protein [Vibrio breoganii]|uniref:VCBS domain-containing protein n=10 Tax=Vibrio TaxID=662 RepID=UPI0021C27B4E|nr:VCBS domain-containing protein [Vibrio breoganii]
MSDKSKQNKDSKSVIKNTDTKAVQKDLSAKADVSKRAVKKERETKKKQIYIPLGLTLSLVLPSFRKADATETDTSSAIAPLESHSKISAPTVHHATETEHSASATSLVQQNIITTADEKDSNSIHSQAHSSNYSHHPVISHPFMNVGYDVANTHASELQGYQTASPQQPTESTVTYREETLTGKYGTLTVGPDGHYAYNLNPKSPAFILLQGHELGTDSFVIHLSNGLQQTVAVPITGNNEAAQFSGDLAGAVTEDLNVNSNGLITTQGTLAVSDQDHDQDSLVAVHNQATKYGEFSIDESGHWQYQVNNAGNTVQALSSGQMLQETITVHSVDGTEQQIVVTINGQDDTAVISGNDLGSVVEDKQPQVSGKLDVTDPDASQQHFQGGDLVGTLGTLHLQDNGAWTYDLDNTNPKVQALGQGSNATDTITVQSADGTTHKVTITVNGTNDKAVIAGTDSGAVTEESQLQTSGTLTVTDVDTGEAHFSNTDVVGTLGTLHLKDNGAWSYDLDNTNPTVQALGQGKTATDTITVQSADGTTHKVTITVNGTNDKAVIAGTDSGAVTEESQLQTSGTLTATDVDTGEAHFSNTDVVGTLGTLHLKDNGAWSYDLDNTNPTVQALGKGATATDTITVQSADGTTHKVTITVNGTNDKAVIAGTDSGAVTEESQLQTSGTLTVTDVDTGEAHFSNTDVVGTLGTLHLKDNGAWTYDLDNTNPKVQALGNGATATDTITVHSADGTPHQVKITVNGTNDKAVIAGTDSGAVTEESQLQTSGTLTVTDVDTGEAHFSNTDIAGTLGTLHLTDSGAWTYDLDNTNPTVQALSKGATATDTITVQSADGTTHKVTITVNGTNDKAVIAGSDSGAVTEESQLQTSGTLTVTDVDTGEAHFSNTDVVGTLGTLHLKDNGAWTYDLDNTNPKVQALGNGATATDTITVHSADGTPHQVKITVNGTNDKAVIAGTDSGAVTEESQLQTSGTLTVTDVDTGEAHFSNTDIAGTLGTLHLTDSGAWTYDLDNTNPTVQALSKGATATDTITVQSADGTTHKVTITVNGTNDKAVIAGTDSGAVTEESQLQTSGTLTVTDVDTGEAHFSNTDIAGNLGTLHLTDSGAWTYDLDNTNPTVQALGKGATATDIITVQSADGTTHKVTITVNGTNDKAVIAGTDSGAVTEESQLQTSGTLTVTDVDTGEAHFSNTDVVGTLGTLHLKDNGAWTYDLDNTNPTVQALGKGATATDTITVQSADGTTHKVTITVNGTNDKAVIAGTDSGAVTEESQLQTSGTLTVTDVDTGEAHFSNTDIAGTLGTLHLKDNGAWTYDLDNTNPTVQALGKGATATDTITVQSADGTTHKVTITVNGTNDKAVIAGTDSGAVTEESQLQTSGTLTVTDVDTGEAHFSNTDVAGNLGTLHLTDSGAWTYDLDNSNPAVQALAKGQHAKDIITVHSTDGTPHQVAITVNGANDAAQITGTTTGAVTEDRIYGMQWLVVNSHMNVTDTDAGEAHFDPVLHAQNNAGIGYTSTLGASVVVAPDGDWHYQLDNNIQQVQSLGQGQSYVDKVTVHTVDGTTQELQITITGTNDAPTVTGSRVLPVGTEDQTLRITQTQLVAGATDIDKNDAGTLHVDAVTADHGTVTHNADGSFTFHPDQDYNGKVQFTYDVKDAHGGSVQATASSTLAATADAATISGVDTGDVHEGHTFTAPDGSMTGGYVDDRSPDHMHGNIGKLWNDEIHTDGHLSIVDADAGESYAQTGVYYGSHGRVILQTNGDWSYFASIGQDATGRAIDHLGKGESLTDTVTVKSADGTTHDIVITIHGDNDRPYCSGEVQLNSGKEDLAQTITVSELLANTVDVDTNDIGKLTITNLHADHGSILDNQDGTFTFTPTKDYNGQVHFTYDVQDAHGGVTHTGATTSLSAVGDTAVIGGQDTFTVQEDHNLTLNSGSTIIYNGQLTITDADAGENHFDSNLHQNQQTGTWDTGYTTQEGGKLILQSNGSYRYEIDNSLVKIQSLGSSETLIDTVTVRSADGTPHQIQVTIQGDNDAPVVSSAVTLAAGTEDTDVVLHASDLLANATDIDHNDAGKLSVANLIADHGNITDNHDGTFTFHPTQDYNGKVSFTYDVQDAHGGSVATSASITLAPTRDSAVISGDNTGTIIEDHNVGHSSLHPVAASGLLSVTDPDAGQDHFQVNRLLGEQAIHDPFGGFLRITPNGAWGYEVANSRLQSLAEGEVEKVVYRVYSADHTAHDITITVTGTNDRPTITATTLAHGTEDTHYQMQASQFGFTDIDTGDTLHSIAITDLPPATQGKFLLDGHDVTTGQQIPTADISKLQFVPAQDFNGDVQFKYTVNDGHTDSTEASNTLHIDAVGDSAVITGTITGDVDEGHGTYHDRSPNYAQPGMAKLTNDPLYTDGKLEIIDPDTGEAQFDTKGVGYSYHGTYGQLILNADGNWHYKVTVGSNQQNVATQIDQLGDGQQLTDTITVYSKDGTAQDIVITIHGDNDRPYISSEVTLATGTEDTALTFTKADLLANTVDVDANDAGKLSIANLLVDHGSVVDNKDGTYTFTPDKDYNGQVHFAYDVKDAHGGVTHTGASTTLAAVDDKTIISGVDHGVATEDVATVVYTNPHIMDAVDWQALQITDVDSPNTQVTVEFAGKQYTWNIGSDLDVTTPYGRFQFHTIASGPHQGEHSWSYIGDNNNVHVQELKHGESFTESIKLIATDGTEFPITVKVNGTEDGVIIDSNSELGHVVENAQTGASVSGNVVAHDVDLHDTVSWTQTPTGGISGQYGTFHLSADGQWHYDVDQSKATKLGDGDEYWEHFTVEAVSTDGSHVSKSVSVVVHGNNDVPTVSGEVSLPSGKEDTSIHITQAELIANATDVDTNDRGWLHVENLTADHGNLVSNSDGSFTFNPDPNYNGTVHFTYDVADRHGGIAHTGANTTLAAVNDVATFTGDSGSIGEDTNLQHNIHISGQPTVPDALVCQGHLVISDVDGQGEAALDLKGQSLVSQDGTYGHFIVKPNGSWLYTADNNSVPIQDLDNGQTLTDSIEITSKDGTKHSITVTINGTTDAPSLHSLTDSGIQNSGPIEGNLITGLGTHEGLSGAATDTDSNAHLVLQDIQIKDPVSGYVAVKPGQPHTMMGIGTLAIEANGHYTFTPEAGFSGKVPNMVYRVGDEGGNPIGDSSQNSLSIEVTPPLQHAPTVTGQTVSTNEDITRTITTSEFGYSDQDGDALQFVTINSIPSHGLLLLNGNAVTANQQISKADLDAGHLTFTPNNNENGANYAQFTFTANDGHKNSANATMVVDVNAVNDAPIVGSSFISSLEDKPHAFTTADFKYSDIDGDALNHITITNVAHGVLSLNGTTVNVGDDVSASDVSSLIFTPTHNYFSSGVSGLGGVQFTANDGHLDSKEGSILINIASVADPATFSGDSTGVAKEDITLQASGTLTASDPDGTAGFTAVQGGAGIAGSKGYGHAHIDVNGHWTYDLDNNHPIVQQLSEGQTDTETITVQSADGTHHDIVVTITGTNDAPILGVNQTSSTTGTLTETDVDVTDSHTFSIVSSTGQFGSLSVDPNTGDYIYTPNTSITGMSYNSATNSYHGVDVFEVKVSDGHTEDSKFITFDASGHVTMSPTGGLVISTTVPQQPTVTTTLPTMLMVTNVATTNSVTLDLASTSDSGSSNTDNLTNDTTPTITGHTDIPFSKVTVYDGSTPVGHAVSDASGQYSVAVSSLSEGDHNLSAKALAPSSVVPATSSLLSVHIDTQVHVGIQTDPITADNVINAQESNSSIDITGSVSGDYNAGDIVTLDVNGTQHTGAVDAKGHYSIAVPGSELIADADQKIEASIAVTDTAGNSAHATTDVTYQVDTQVSVPTITFENAGADNLYSKAEIARGQANTITATVTPPGDAKIGEHLVVNGQDHVLDAHSLQHGIQIEVHPGSNVQATMTDEHGNTAGSQGFAASAIPEPIIVRPPSGSHQVSGTLGVPPLLPSLTPVPTAQSGWRIHLPNGQYVTSHQGQYGTLTIDPKTGYLHYQEQAQVHTGPHGSASGIGQHEDKFEVALQGTNQDEVVAHVNIQILSHGPGHSGKLTVGTEVVDMTITPIVHTSHPAPPPPPPPQSDESHSSPETIEVTLYADDDNTHHDLMAGLSALADDHSSSGSNPYTDIVGLHDAPQADDSAMPTPEPAPDLDLLLNQADDLAHQHPVDAFIDNNGEEHKADDQHVLDEEHIQHDLPDVMDLPDHHH